MSGDPLGVAELVAAVEGCARVLDLGCGTGRLTIPLAARGADVTGLDSNRRRLDELGRRANAQHVVLRAVEADMQAPLPFADGAFDAATSRLSLMIAGDPAATLREAARVVHPGGTLATAVWAAASANPWFDEPRAAVGVVLGPDRAAFARAFGRLGSLHELEAVHEEAGLRAVRGRVLSVPLRPGSAAEHWEHLTSSIGHFRRIAESLSADEADALRVEVERRLERFRDGPGLVIPRAMLIVTARVGAAG